MIFTAWHRRRHHAQNRVIGPLRDQPFRAPSIGAQRTIQSFSSTQRLLAACLRTRPTAESHCQRACIKGTKKPIGDGFPRSTSGLSTARFVVAARKASSAPPHRSTIFAIFFHLFFGLTQPVELQIHGMRLAAPRHTALAKSRRPPQPDHGPVRHRNPAREWSGQKA